MRSRPPYRDVELSHWTHGEHLRDTGRLRPKSSPHRGCLPPASRVAWLRRKTTAQELPKTPLFTTREKTVSRVRRRRADACCRESDNTLNGPRHGNAREGLDTIHLTPSLNTSTLGFLSSCLLSASLSFLPARPLLPHDVPSNVLKFFLAIRKPPLWFLPSLSFPRYFPSFL